VVEDNGYNRDLLGIFLEKEFQDLVEEYETRQSIEAKIAKDADNLDTDFELAEQASKGSSLKGLWQSNREFVARERLYTKTAKRVFDQLVQGQTNPHHWHLNGRNRRNAGDWKK
jgi:5'-deoxynucleotidase YfbR-like HD superfamily hydrolase